MTDIRIYNTKDREKQVFNPIDPLNVRMYVCGPTVYDYAHIGNARPVVVFDIFYRLLCHIYGASRVTYARNITDIDDKIMDRAKQSGVGIKTITKKYTQAYERNMAALCALAPNICPKATDHLPEMIKMMQALLAKGHAYVAEGHVMFSVSSMDGYGRLSRHSRDELVAGARVDVAPYKKDPADFVLWKPSDDTQVGWKSPWGRGRPGWHLECSCMIEKHLGETIDIHGGGQDLIFPHHENEIAQSECTHDRTFVNYWMHNGYLTVDGEKMSKSLGNFHTVEDLLKDHTGEALRLSLLIAHYRQPVDFSVKSVREQKKRLDKWYRLTDGVESVQQIPTMLIEALADDVNTPKALAVLDGLATAGEYGALKAGAKFMGFLQQSASDWFTAVEVDTVWIEGKISAYEMARSQKDFHTADGIRNEFAEHGLMIEVGPTGTTWRKK